MRACFCTVDDQIRIIVMVFFLIYIEIQSERESHVYMIIFNRQLSTKIH